MEELGSFLRKNDRQLKQTTLSALQVESLVLPYPHTIAYPLQ